MFETILTSLFTSACISAIVSGLFLLKNGREQREQENQLQLEQREQQLRLEAYKMAFDLAKERQEDLNYKSEMSYLSEDPEHITVSIKNYFEDLLALMKSGETKGTRLWSDVMLTTIRKRREKEKG